MNRDGEGEGKLSLATKITADKASNTVVLENYDIQPVLLQSVRRERASREEAAAPGALVQRREKGGHLPAKFGEALAAHRDPWWRVRRFGAAAGADRRGARRPRSGVSIDRWSSTICVGDRRRS